MTSATISLGPAQFRVEVQSIEKSFAGIHALRGINLGIRAGTIHGLIGENGAGKSTLGRILAGATSPDRGRILIDGKPVTLNGPRDALRQGVGLVAQELNVVPRMTVIDNVFLGNELSSAGRLRLRSMRRRYAELQERYGFAVPADTVVGTLRLVEQQKVEILRTLARDAEIIIMDEPTAALPEKDARTLFDIVKSLRERGKTIIYVSHFLNEVLAMADFVTVLKDGQLIDTAPAASETPRSLVRKMLGQEMDLAFPPKTIAAGSDPVLEVDGLTRAPAFHDVSFSVRPGEIVGLAGLVGSGRTEVGRAIYGADRFDSGAVRFRGKALEVSSPKDAIKLGIGLVPESRKDQGLMLSMDIMDNMTMPHLGSYTRGGLINEAGRRTESSRVAERLKIRRPVSGLPVRLLSGGNQQKVLLGRWMMRNAKLLIIDEPTRGVDVGAKQAIYVFLNELAQQGMAILLISSEMEEILGLCNRTVVMREGYVSRELTAGNLTEDSVRRAAFGMQEEGE
ncbi:sugar ABC transporter ATP-binding protein [Mesorhizobium sp. M1329]|uniref:sugar ABC transporter ATP-binding protein n=1 Tax=Mesorhizobium sp. M1329 TaxID=2957083 RepID=UPI00333B8D13